MIIFLFRVMLCWHRWWIISTWHRGNCVKVTYVAGTKLEGKSERSPKPFALSLRIRKASYQYPKSLSVFGLLSISCLPPPLISKLSVFRLLSVSRSLSLVQSQSLHFRSLHSRSRSRSLLLLLRSLSAFFV